MQFMNVLIFEVPFLLRKFIKALPIIAPFANLVACVNVSLLLIPKPTIWEFFKFISEIRLKYPVWVSPNPASLPVTEAEETM